MEKQARAHAIISGRVQGVFFRVETQRAAEQFGVSGWVRNKRDGTVEAVFEGPEAIVRQAVSWCRHGDPPARVDDIEVTYDDATGEFKSFRITW